MDNSETFTICLLVRHVSNHWDSRTAMCYRSTAKAAAPKTNTDIGNEDFKAFIWPLVGLSDFFLGKFLLLVSI